jgi:hypothetical protein
MWVGIRIEHKGVSNRILRELGWVEVMGSRDSPRNNEVKLRAEQELIGLRRELLSLRKDADGFIRRVFHSHDRVWVERCSSITKEMG